jgi:hypothetical protein
MNQPRRRRRRRRKRGGSGGGGAAEGESRPGAQVAGRDEPSRTAGVSRSRRRRRRGRGDRKPGDGPRTLEEVVASIKPPRPERLTADPDGQVLEEIIGDLQGTLGVPQYPQEFRITIKVAEERNGRADSQTVRAHADTAVTREKAPAAPSVGPESPDDSPERERAPGRKRRARRGRRRRGGGGGS